MFQPGVLNFDFGISVQSKRLQMGAEERKWILAQFEALELKFCQIWGFGIEIFVNLGSRTASISVQSKRLQMRAEERSGMKDRGLKNWFFEKNRGLRNWILVQFEALELKFCQIWGFEIEFFVNLGSRTASLVKSYNSVEKGLLQNWNMLKWGSSGTAERAWKGVSRAAHPRTPFQGEYPPGVPTFFG